MVLLKAVINFRKPSSVGKKNLQRTTIMIMISFISCPELREDRSRTEPLQRRAINSTPSMRYNDRLQSEISAARFLVLITRKTLKLAARVVSVKTIGAKPTVHDI